MSTTSDKAKQTKYLRSELKKAEELAVAYTQHRDALLKRLCTYLCPFKVGDRIERVPGVRGTWELTNVLHWKAGEVRVLKKVRLHNFAFAFDRNPLFEVVLDPSYGGTLCSNEVSFTLNQLKHSFRKVEA
jgi:hypothetical protein